MEHPYGPLSLAPPVVAIVLAIVTRRPVLSLLIGIFCGALVTAGGDPITAVADTLETHLWATLVDAGRIRIFAFTLTMAALVGVISRSNGMQGLVDSIARFAKSRRSGQVTSWVLGWVIFFDDYTNSILLGGTLRPLFDRLKISREKLAYLVDSTAAPIASLALLSTWIAAEVDFINQGIEKTDGASELKAMELFIASIPYRFYALMALLFVLVIAWTGRDFGPMWKAEQRRMESDGDELGAESEVSESLTSQVPARWFNAAIPIAVTLLVVMALLYQTGTRNLGLPDSAKPPMLRDVLGAADSSLSLFYGALAGLLVASLLAIVQRILTLAQIRDSAVAGMKIVVPAILILWTASSLSSLTGNQSVDGQSSEAYEFQDHRLYTGKYLADTILPSADSDQPPPSDLTIVKWLPTLVFVLAAILSFSTGTSWGTMGILMPMTISVVFQSLQIQSEVVSPTDPILLACIASVLSGSVFGDHCSPISDTTILSSQACGCDHIAHVTTQMPYAIVVGMVSIVLGTIPLGWAVSVWILIPMQAMVLVAIVFGLGRKVGAST